MGKLATSTKPAADLSAMPDPDPEPAAPAPDATPTKVGPAKAQADLNWFGDLSDEEDFIKILYYGREGVGKTSASVSAANHGRILVVNAEAGLKKRPLAQLGIEVKNVMTWPPQGKENALTSDGLMVLHERLLADLRDDPDSWFAVVFDSISEIHQKLREQATDKRVRKVSGSDPDWVDRDDYGVMTAQMRKIVRRFRDLPCHVIFTALETDDEKQNVIRPAITPALCTDVLGYVDVVARMGSPVGDYRARTRALERIRAKDRFSALPNVMMDPNFNRVREYIAGELTEDADPLQEALREEERAALEAAAAEEATKATKATRRRPSRAKAATEAPKAEEPAETGEAESAAADE